MPHVAPISVRHRIVLALLGLMMFVPFVQPLHLQPIPSFYSEMAAATLGLLAACALLLGSPARSAVVVPRPAWIPAVLIATIATQWTSGRIEFPEVALLDALFLLWAALLAIVGATLTRQIGPESLVRTLAGAITVGGVISNLVAAIQFSRWPAPAWLVFADGIASTNLGQRNHAADYLWLAVVSTTGLRARGMLPAWTAIALLTMLVGGAALTGSRGPLAYGVLVTCMSGWWWWRDRVPMARLVFALSAAATVGFVLVSGALSFANGLGILAGAGSAVDRLTLATLAGDARLVLWRDAWRIFSETPWLGCGVGNYPWHSFEMASRTPPGQLALPAEHAHNLLLQWLAEYGLVATLAIAVLLVWWLYDALRQRFDADRWWLLAVLGVIGGHSLLEYPLWYAYFLGPFALILGAGDAHVTAVKMRLGRTIFGLASALAALAMINLWRDEQRIEQSVYHPTAQSMAGLIDVAKASLLSPLARHGIALAMIPKVELASDQAVLCEAALHFRPRPDLLGKCATLKEALGNRQAAEALLTSARHAWPGESLHAE